MNLAIRAHDLGVTGAHALVDQLHTVSLSGVQLVCYKSFADVRQTPGGITRERAEQIGSVLREGEKHLWLIGAYFNPVHSNAKKRADSIAIFKDYIHCAGALGGSIVGSETGSFHDDKWIYHPKNRTEEALQTVVETFRALCDEAAAHGVQVGIEGASGHVCYDVATLKRAVERIDRPNLRVIFDLYNFLDETNAQHYLSILEEGLHAFGARICCFHIKDCRLENGKPIQCAAGKGMFDYKTILGMIRRHDEQAILVLEGTTGEDIPASISFINETWEGVNI